VRWRDAGDSAEVSVVAPSSEKSGRRHIIDAAAADCLPAGGESAAGRWMVRRPDCVIVALHKLLAGEPYLVIFLINFWREPGSITCIPPTVLGALSGAAHLPPWRFLLLESARATCRLGAGCAVDGKMIFGKRDCRTQGLRASTGQA